MWVTRAARDEISCVLSGEKAAASPNAKTDHNSNIVIIEKFEHLEDGYCVV